MTFNYEINERESWPPAGESKPPYSPSSLEVIRSCPLRLNFSKDKRYEKRMGSAARIGTVMHKTIRLISEGIGNFNNQEEYNEEVKKRYLEELNDQKEQSQNHPREKTLDWDPARINSALEAVISEAIRLKEKPSGIINKKQENQIQLEGNDTLYAEWKLELPLKLPATEIRVQSKDNLFVGYIDRIEETEDGIRLIDYKSAMRDDLPERYERQIQLYAKLLNDSTGIWPKEGLVYYPLTGSFYFVPIDKETCNKAYQEAKEIVTGINEKKSKYELAKPGDVCKVCEYRPWCKPFWKWIEAEKVTINAKEKSIMGFECNAQAILLQDHYWRLEMNWRNSKIRFAVPQERFPHLKNAHTGQKFKFLDTSLVGSLGQPTLRIYDTSEIFLVK